MRFRLEGLLVASLVAAVAGCERYDRPNRPVPAEFKARLVGGAEVVNQSTFMGRPWVVTLWVPG